MRFESQQATFDVEWRICSNPGCRCEDATFHFRQTDADGHPLVDGSAIHATVDLATGLEPAPPLRDEPAASVVNHFLAEGRDDLFGSIRQTQAQDRRMAAYRIDPTDVRQGTLIPFTRILSENGSMSDGGRSCTFTLSCEGRTYWAEDLYCPKPSCKCGEVMVLFYGESSSGGQTVITGIFDAIMTLRGKARIEQLHGTAPLDEAGAQRVVDALRAQEPDLPRLLRERTTTVKEIARRSLRAPAAVPQTPAPAVPQPPVTTKVGRNDPCPCGSARKFKKCCGA